MNRTTNITVDYTQYLFCGDISFLPPPDNVARFVAELLIFTLGFLGNIVTVVVISCWRKLLTPTFTMIACLTVSDACSLLVWFIDQLTNVSSLLLCNEFLANFIYQSSFPANRVRKIYNAFSGLARYNGSLQLCVLACLRVTAIVYPHKYQINCTCKTVIVVSIVASVIILIASVVNSAFYQGCATMIPMFAINFIVPTIVFISLYCLKLRALRRSPALNRISSLRMIVVLIFLMSVYVMSSASILFSRIFYCHEMEFHKYFKSILTISYLFNCAVNPFIYFFSSPPIAQFFRKMWHRLCNRHQETDNGNVQDMEMNNITTHDVR